MTNIQYKLHRMNIYSDPVIQLCDPPLVCSVCGEHSHTKGSCHHVRAEDFVNLSHEDRVFWSYVDPCDRPEALCDHDDHHVAQDHEGEPMEEDGDRYSEEQAVIDSDQESSESDNEFSDNEESGSESQENSEESDSDENLC